MSEGRSGSLMIDSCADHKHMVEPRTDAGLDVKFGRCPECGKSWGWNALILRRGEEQAA